MMCREGHQILTKHYLHGHEIRIILQKPLWQESSSDRVRYNYCYVFECHAADFKNTHFGMNNEFSRLIWYFIC